jgi:hypothetical protein
MAGIGYYSGLYEGLDKIANIQNRRADTEMDIARTQALREEAAREQAKFAVDQRQKLLLNNALMGTAAEVQARGNVQGIDGQADVLTKLGNRILGIDPKLGLQFLNQAGDLTAQSAIAKYNGMRTEAAKGDYLADVAYGIKDQATLDDGIERLSKAGVVVPPQFQVWNPETERYFQLKGMASKQRASQLKAEATATRAETGAQAETRKAENQTRRLDQIDREQARKQANYKPPTEFQTQNEVAILSEFEGFDDIPKGRQLQAAEAVYARANEYRMSGMSPEDAMERAREEVVAKFTGKGGSTTGPQIGTVVNGYRFKGGNPNDKANWEKQ